MRDAGPLPEPRRVETMTVTEPITDHFVMKKHATAHKVHFAINITMAFLFGFAQRRKCKVATNITPTHNVGGRKSQSLRIDADKPYCGVIVTDRALAILNRARTKTTIEAEKGEQRPRNDSERER
mmetsp:Transcript_1950/g.4125  ORF Transcript_1950/g.4125 Transcript_1950/m.4125 type:complete len:125 (-) Transcript_1950:862-1236(-)